MYYHTRRIDNGSGSRRRLLSVRSQPRKSIPQMLPCCAHTTRSSLKCSLSEYSSFSSVSLCFLYCTTIKQKNQPFFLQFIHVTFRTSGNVRRCAVSVLYVIFQSPCPQHRKPHFLHPLPRPLRRLSDLLPHLPLRLQHPQPYSLLRLLYLFRHP